MQRNIYITLNIVGFFANSLKSTILSLQKQLNHQETIENQQKPSANQETTMLHNVLHFHLYFLKPWCCIPKNDRLFLFIDFVRYKLRN